MVEKCDYIEFKIRVTGMASSDEQCAKEISRAINEARDVRIPIVGDHNSV